MPAGGNRRGLKDGTKRSVTKKKNQKHQKPLAVFPPQSRQEGNRSGHNQSLEEKPRLNSAHEIRIRCEDRRRESEHH